MTLKEIFETNLVNDFTKVIIRNSEFQIITAGNWYQDNILNFFHCEIESFIFQNDNTLYVDIKSCNSAVCIDSYETERERLETELEQCRAYISDLEKYKTFVTDMIYILEKSDIRKAGV